MVPVGLVFGNFYSTTEVIIIIKLILMLIGCHLVGCGKVCVLTGMVLPGLALAALLGLVLLLGVVALHRWMTISVQAYIVASWTK